MSFKENFEKLDWHQENQKRIGRFVVDEWTIHECKINGWDRESLKKYLKETIERTIDQEFDS